MDKREAEDIYWVMSDKYRFTMEFQDDADYERIKKERVKIANRYIQLKSTNSFLDAERIATVEWLCDYLCEKKQ